MGILDTVLGAPGSQQSQAMGILGHALATGQGVGAFGYANQLFSPENQMKMRMAQLELENAEGSAEDRKRKRDFLASLPDPTFAAGQQALAGGGGPTLTNAAAIRSVNPYTQQLFEATRAGVVPYADYLKASAPKGLEFSKVDPKDYTPESLREASATGDYTKLVPVRKLDVVNGQAVNLYNAQPGTVFDNVDPNKPFNLRGGQAVPNTAFQSYELNKARAGKTEVNVNTGQKGLDNELKIRSDFRSEPIYKAHQDVQSAYAQISAALKQQSPAGDLAAATKFMKVLDPGSVVRESELGMAMAATGALDRLENYVDMLVKGTKLTPQQRKDFQGLTDKLYAESINQYNNKRNEYAKFATDYQLNGDRILGPAITSPKLPATSTSSSPAAPGAGVRFLGFE